MTPHIINLGVRFSLPFANRVASLRRIISVNPAVPLSRIRKYIRAGETVLSPLPESLGLTKPTYSRKRRIRKQCPICADLLYYTDIYEVPWISHCPVHGCAFTETCPACNKPWPTVQNISASTCEQCGIKSFDSLAKTIRRISWQLVYDKLSPIQTLIMGPRPRNLIADRSTSSNTGSYHTWFKEVPIHSEYYPSFAVIDQPLLKKSELEALHVKFVPVTLAPLRLHKERKNISGDVRSDNRRKNESVSDGLNLFNSNRLKEQLALEYTMLKTILGWIDKNTSPGHRPTVSFRIKNSLSYPGCTYCLALSYWLKLRAYQRSAIRARYPHFSPDYVAPELLPLMLKACDLQLVDTKLHKESRDALYLRSLEVSFTALHKALVRFRDKSTLQSNVHATQYESYDEPLEVPVVAPAKPNTTH
jgi:hypothetical protein